MAANTKFPLNPKKARIAPSASIPDGARRPECNADKDQLVAKTKKAKAAKSKVAGRMPERSEAVSGIEADGLIRVSAATPTSVTSATIESKSNK
jgi:hypothetical protein